MNEQFVIPPARVWEKIENILDEQDRLKVLPGRENNAIRSKSSAFNPSYYQTKSSRNSFYFGVSSLLLLIGLLYRAN